MLSALDIGSMALYFALTKKNSQKLLLFKTGDIFIYIIFMNNYVSTARNFYCPTMLLHL